MGKLRKLLKCSPAELLLLVKVAGLLVIVDCGLRLWPFPRLQAILARRRWRWRTPQTVGERVLNRLVWAVEVSGRYGGASCLKQALTLQWLLSRRGVSTRLWLGVQSDEATLRAHAWLEHDGRVIIGGALAEGYTPLHGFDGGDALTVNTTNTRI
jgi:hypothetical protein